ncbi:MAG TPA: flagellar motor switch protein FliG, partial [Burkholderiales bacterium]|nr:flagellar motor switch protein FliG [Burkholderiales bacterium]
MNEEGIERGAILLLSLGEEGATEVFKHLGPREVQKLGTAMSNLKNVTRDKVEQVLSAFRLSAEEKSPLGLNSREYLRTVLTKALGDDKATNLIDRILHGGDTSGIDGLKWMDSPAVAELIKNEHPQIIATILVHLERDQASEVLTELPERLRNDVLLRIATLDGIQPAALKELNDVLAKLLAGNNNLKKSPMGGVRAAAEILNFMSGNIEGGMIESVK